MKGQLVSIYLLMILTFASAARYTADSRSLIEFKENSSIDWTTGVVAAKRIGDPATDSYHAGAEPNSAQTLSEAINRARHNLLETIVGIRINSETRVIDIVENYFFIMRQLRGMILEAPEVNNLRKHLYDGAVEVWSQIELNGAFTQLILPPEIRQIESIKQVLPLKNPASLQTRSRSSEIYTGMVVDARRIEALPVMAPRILDENLEEVFGPTYASREFAVQHGMVRYTTNVWQAKYHARVSDNPIVVKALKSIWPGRCDFIISNADADKLRSASEHLLFLRQCRVIIVLDPM